MDGENDDRNGEKNAEHDRVVWLNGYFWSIDGLAKKRCDNTYFAPISNPASHGAEISGGMPPKGW